MAIDADWRWRRSNEPPSTPHDDWADQKRMGAMTVKKLCSFSYCQATLQMTYPITYNIQYVSMCLQSDLPTQSRSQQANLNGLNLSALNRPRRHA